MTNQEDWYKEYQERRDRETQKAREKIRTNATLLAHQGYKLVVFVYDGMGDNGCVEYVTVQPGPGSDHPLINDMYDAVYTLLPDGWEINDGSYGEFVVNCETGECYADHNWRIEVTRHERHEF